MATVNESAKQSAKEKNTSANQHRSASADVDTERLSIADAAKKFYEIRSDFYESIFETVDQQAAIDVVGKFLKRDKQEKHQVGSAFFSDLVNTRQKPLTFGLLPSLFLPEAVNDSELDALCDRNDQLIALEESGNITPEELEELAQIQKKLDELGALTEVAA